VQLITANNPTNGCAEQGIARYNAATGALLQRFAAPLGIIEDPIAADDAGNVYSFNGANIGPSLYSRNIVKYAIGGNTMLASYTPTSQERLAFAVSPGGEVVAEGLSYADPERMSIYAAFDVWDPGKTGSPSRTFTYSASGPFAVDPNGTLYIEYATYSYGSTVYAYDVIPAGQAAPSRTIFDTVAPKNVPYFDVSRMAATADGTLYVAEWDNDGPDVAAGLYVYAPGGTQTRVTSMPEGIEGLDFDGAGNVYVASNNASLYGNDPNQTCCTADTAQQITVYTPQAAAMLRQFKDNVPDVSSLTVGNDGSTYLVQSANSRVPNSAAQPNIYAIAPNATTASLLIPDIDAKNIILLSGGNVKR
jgi:hypothetical protein